jgi:hypothetical protein
MELWRFAMAWKAVKRRVKESPSIIRFLRIRLDSLGPYESRADIKSTAA